MQVFASFSADRKMKLAENYSNLLKTLENNKETYLENSTQDEYELMTRFAWCAQQGTRMFSAESRMDGGLIRDSAMATNTLWILDVPAKDTKAIIWAHNVHIAKSEFEMTGETAPIEGMGYLLTPGIKR